ncbi:MAG: helix-turn-helix domain-containing protein [Bacteriovoracaceae bacterium]|nr:helix-turn-helix domain-containing protein [Bacteriovoracaceae bacterium]
MIKTEQEYTEAKKRLEQEFKELEAHQMKMKKAGLTKDQIQLAIDPLASFAFQLKEEVEEYEKIKRGEFGALENLEGLGRMLVAVRISKGIKQKDLAEKLGVKETQVSRDERNEYHGASIEKIQKVLNALGVTLKSEVDGVYKVAG